MASSIIIAGGVIGAVWAGIYYLDISNERRFEQLDISNERRFKLIMEELNKRPSGPLPTRAEAAEPELMMGLREGHFDINHDIYNSPFVERWCRNSKLLTLFSQNHKTILWRKLWIWLAESERELGLDALITEEMIKEMEQQLTNINWDRVRELERELKHDVMAHIHAYGEVCPKAKGIIHLGATSCFVKDNADLIVQREALKHVMERLAVCLDRLAKFADRNAAVPIVGRTNYQPASLTTVGKRAALWSDGLLDALKLLEYVYANFRFRGVKGVVGTQDALLQLFDGDANKVKKLDDDVASKAGFAHTFSVTGQTYPRYQDSDVLYALAKVAAAASKFAMDMRMLQAFGEMSEPFGAKQVGCSALPYKQNPILCERICGIARALMINSLNGPLTYALQGFERTLDYSANRRIVLAQAFLAADAILSILQYVLEGMQVHYAVVEAHVRASEAPLERALMLLTKRGVDRQEAHARIRQIALDRRARAEAEVAQGNSGDFGGEKFNQGKIFK